jgi:NADH-quinone oxidoreductase subunit L
MLRFLWLIPVLPLLGAALNGLFGPRLSKRVVGGIACGVVLLAFLLSAVSVYELSRLPADERHVTTEALGTWLPLGPVGSVAEDLRVGWGFSLDPLSSVMILIVTGVGFLIHVYATGYMAHEEGFSRFFTYMNLFLAMMLTLVLGSNLLVMFVGWEGVGLCSYLLIGFFYDRPFDERTGMSCADAGRKAFVVNRIGDFAFLIGVLYLATAFGTLEFREITQAIVSGGAPHALLVGVGILLFLGACGKSAQIPLYVWLPDAMAGPTPVSALIHAATMVTAGVYMVTRMSGLYTAAPEAMAVVAVVGAGTAIFAATMGMAATDIKKVLAYSTVSQLGYMFAGAGVGAFGAAIFHLMTHAFFKALLFLGAGSVIHGLEGEQDIRKMGGLRKRMPVTFWTFFVGTLAIAGIVPLAGFFSKDEILWGAFSSGHKGVWATLLLGAGVTGFYMFRLVTLVFLGDERSHAHAHESPKSMTVPLVILAVLSVVGGWVGISAAIPVVGSTPTPFDRWLDPSIVRAGHDAGHGAHGSLALERGLMGLAFVAALLGFLAIWMYLKRPVLVDRMAKGFGSIYTMVRNYYWVDELYELVVLRPFYALCRLASAFDRWVVDGSVNATGILADVTGQIVRLFQTGYVRNYALFFLVGAVAILFYLATL